MASTSGTIEILQPADKVMAVIADIRRYPEWVSGMSDIVIEEGADSLPAFVTSSISAGPIKDRVKLGYEWSSHAVSWKLVQASALKTMSGNYTVEPVTNGSKVTYTVEIELVAPLPRFLMSTAEKTIITTALNGLKKFCESGAR